MLGMRKNCCIPLPTMYLWGLILRGRGFVFVWWIMVDVTLNCSRVVLMHLFLPRIGCLTYFSSLPAHLNIFLLEDSFVLPNVPFDQFLLDFECVLCMTKIIEAIVRYYSCVESMHIGVRKSWRNWEVERHWFFISSMLDNLHTRTWLETYMATCLPLLQRKEFWLKELMGCIGFSLPS